MKLQKSMKLLETLYENCHKYLLFVVCGCECVISCISDDLRKISYTFLPSLVFHLNFRSFSFRTFFLIIPHYYVFWWFLSNHQRKQIGLKEESRKVKEFKKDEEILKNNIYQISSPFPKILPVFSLQRALMSFAEYLSLSHIDARGSISYFLPIFYGYCEFFRLIISFFIVLPHIPILFCMKRQNSSDLSQFFRFVCIFFP